MTSVIDLIIAILFINTILILIGTIIFVYVCIYEKELFSYFPIYLLFLIGNLFIINQFLGSIYRLVGMVFFMATALSLFFAAFLDYYKIIIKSAIKKAYISNFIIAAVSLSSFIGTIQIFMMIILIISSIMLLRVYLKTRSTVKLLFMMCGLVATSAQISQLNPYFDLDFGLFVSYIIGTVYITILIINGVVATLEQKIRKTVKIKESLKDNYSHDLGNILLSLSLSYELIKSDRISELESIKLHHVLEDKILEASELVKEIRKL